MIENTVTLSLDVYNDMRDSHERLLRENQELKDAIQALQDNDGQRVIIREKVVIYDDDDRREKKRIYVQNFADVEKEVCEKYQDDIQEVNYELKKLKEDYESMIESKRELGDNCLELEMEISRLKNRTLWQRIKNV